MESKKFYLPSAEIEPDLYQWLKELAEKESRSMSGQLIHMLKEIKKQGDNK